MAAPLPSATYRLADLDVHVTFPHHYSSLVESQKSGTAATPPLLPHLVLCLHGRMSSHEAMRPTCEALAAAGFVAARFDLPNHGDAMASKPEYARNYGWDKGNLMHATDMYIQILRAAQSLALVPQGLAASGVRFDKIAVWGVSQGAHTALLAMTQDNNLAACVSIIGSADYERLFHIRFQRAGGGAGKEVAIGETPRTWEEVYPHGLAELVRMNDTIRRVEYTLKRRAPPLFMTSGETDKLVPPETSAILETVLRPAYDALDASGRESLRHQIYPKTGHRFTDDMMRDGVAFLLKWMTPQIPHI